MLSATRLALTGGVVGNRDVDRACGYPAIVDAADYRRMFYRGDVAARIVALWPNETWSVEPYVTENAQSAATGFEQAVADMDRRLGLWSTLHALDVLAGIGRYGVLLIGYSDTDDLSRPAPESGAELVYLRPLDETQATIAQFETAGPRAGLPEYYNAALSGPGESAQTQRRVHWSRVIHVVDNALGSAVYGVPRLMPVYNRLLDLKKIAGGSAEMFWAGGFPGLSLEANASPDTRVKLDIESLRSQLESYLAGLQRYIALVGMNAKSLSPQVADPRPHMEVQLRLIAAALGVPWRVFQGSEQGQLASEQDVITWGRQVQRRREFYATRALIRPLLDRLIAAGALPEPTDGYDVHWPAGSELSARDRVEIAERKTNALVRYSDSSAPAYVPPFHFLTEVLDIDDEVARAMLAEAEAAAADQEPPAA